MLINVIADEKNRSGRKGVHGQNSDFDGTGSEEGISSTDRFQEEGNQWEEGSIHFLRPLSRNRDVSRRLYRLGTKSNHPQKTEGWLLESHHSPRRRRARISLPGGWAMAG